jgi:hypothetical protein
MGGGNDDYCVGCCHCDKKVISDAKDITDVPVAKIAKIAKDITVTTLVKKSAWNAVTVSIPDSCVKNVIGPKRITLERIKRRSECNVEISETSACGLRTIKLSGSACNVKIAKLLIGEVTNLYIE